MMTWIPLGRSGLGELDCDLGGSMGRDDPDRWMDPKLFQLIEGPLHDGQVTVGTHDHGYRG